LGSRYAFPLNAKMMSPTLSPDPAAADPGNASATLIVQRNELTSFPQALFSGSSMAFAGDAIPFLSPGGYLDHVLNRARGSFGGEDDLQ